MKKNEKGRGYSEFLNIRLGEDTAKMLYAQSSMEKISVSQLVREALNDRLYRDTAWQGQVQCSVEVLRNEVKKIRRDVELFADFFRHWTEYYFMYTRNLSDLDREEKQMMWESGRERTSLMVEAFRQKIKKERPGLIEIMLADYITEEDNGK